MALPPPPVPQAEWDTHLDEQFDKSQQDADRAFAEAQRAQERADAAAALDFEQRAEAQFRAATRPVYEAEEATAFALEADDQFERAASVARRAQQRPGMGTGSTASGAAATAPGGVYSTPGGSGSTPSDQRSTGLARIYQDALAAGLDEEGARVAVAVARTEGGLEGAVGDLDHNPLGAAGAFQFNFGGGMGNAYAKSRGVSEQQARDELSRDPHAGNQYALTGYLGQAIREGQAKGLRGPALAEYAQRHGQRSVSPERAAANYAALQGTSFDEPAQNMAMGLPPSPGAEKGQYASARANIIDNARSGIRSRAESYLGTPYLWGGADKQGIDCSAFISRAWGVGRQTTDTLAQVADPIAKERLQPGDALNLTTGQDPRGYGHVRMFDGWADPKHETMWVYESSTATGGVARRVIPYDAAYTPMRLKGLTDEPPREVAARMHVQAPPEEAEQEQPGRPTTTPIADGVTDTGDRPPSSFEPPSQFAGAGRSVGGSFGAPLEPVPERGQSVGGSFADEQDSRVERRPINPDAGFLERGAQVTGDFLLDRLEEGNLQRRTFDTETRRAHETGDYGRAIEAAEPIALSLSPEPLANVGRRVVGEAGAAGAGAVQRFFHGTGSAFDTPDPARFDDNGLVGPGYYVTDAPRVAGTGDPWVKGYAEKGANPVADAAELRNAQEDLARLERDLARIDPGSQTARRLLDQKARLEARIEGTARNPGPNVRAIDVPRDLNLFDLDQPTVPANVIDRVEAATGPLPMLAREPNGMNLYHAIVDQASSTSDAPKAAANKILAAVGFDGITYAGGRRIPMSDEAGNPIEHTAIAIFPESLPKIRNAISGREGGNISAGLAVDAGSLGAGAAAGYATSAPQGPDESDAAYAARVAAQTGAGAAAGLAGSVGLRSVARRLQGRVDTVARGGPLEPGLPGLADVPTRATKTDLRGVRTPEGTAPPSLYDRFQTVRFASMLSSTATQVLNNTANAVNVGSDVPLKVLQVGVDAVVSGVTRTERTRYLAEVLPQARGQITGMIAGAKQIPGIMAQGVDARTVEAMNVPRKGLQSGSKTVDAIVEAPLRALSAADAMWRGAATGGHAAALATRQAIKEGLEGAERSARVDHILSRLEEFPQIAQEAERLGARAVFQEHRTQLDPIVNIAKGQYGKYVGDVVLPFVRTPGNVAAQGIGMTPAGFVGALEAAKNGNRGEAIDRAVRAAVGTAAMGLGFSLASSGFVTGAYPKDASDRSTLPEGWKPYSLRVPVDDGAVYVPLQMFGPVAMPLGIAAAVQDLYAQQQTGADPKKLAMRSLTTLGKYVGDQAFLQGLAAVPNIIEEPERYLDHLLANYGSSLMPASGFQKQINQFIGRAARDPGGAIEGFLAASPLTSEGVPSRQTPLGDERAIGPSGPAAFLTGTRVSTEQDEKTLAVLRAAGVGAPTVADSYGGITLTDEQKRTIRERTGSLLRARLRSVSERSAAANPANVERVRDEAAADARESVLARARATQRPTRR